MSRERLGGEVGWKSTLAERVQWYIMCYSDLNDEENPILRVCVDWLVSKTQWKRVDGLHISDKNDVSEHTGHCKEARNFITSSSGKLSYPVAGRWGWGWGEQAQTWWLIFSRSGLPLCKRRSRVNKHIDRPVSGNAEHKGEKKTSVHEEQRLIGKLERKRALQAVCSASSENKGSETFRHTLQTGSLPGVFQPNVFKCILLITKL